MSEERQLERDELSELESLLPEAYEMLGNNKLDNPADIVKAIRRKVDDLRENGVSEDNVTNVAFPLGYLYGEQFRRAFGWDWCYVTQDNGFASYCVAHPERYCVVFAMKSVYDKLLKPTSDNSIALLFNMIAADGAPVKERNRYMSLG